MPLREQPNQRRLADLARPADHQRLAPGAVAPVLETFIAWRYMVAGIPRACFFHG